MLDSLLKIIKIKSTSEITDDYILESCENTDLYIVLPKKNKDRLLLIYKNFLEDNYSMAQQIISAKKGVVILITAILQKNKTTLSSLILNKYGSFNNFIESTEPTLSSYSSHTITEIQEEEEETLIFEDTANPPIAPEYFEEAINYVQEISQEHEVALASIKALAESDYFKASTLLAQLLDSLEDTEKGSEDIC